MDMFSLDFEEFLWDMGKGEEAIGALKTYFEHREKVDSGIHEQFMGLLREYLVVGGMPEAVNIFLKSNNYQDVYATQKKIMESYKEDIKHYASTPMRQKIEDCYRSIPRQLAKKYTKFQYKVVSKECGGKRCKGHAAVIYGFVFVKDWGGFIPLPPSPHAPSPSDTESQCRSFQTPEPRQSVYRCMPGSCHPDFPSTQSF